jgi:hypothetical protein
VIGKGLTHSKLAGLEDKKDNRKKAIHSFNESFKVVNEQNHAGLYNSIKDIVCCLKLCDNTE